MASVLVTGTNQGIGFGIVEQLAKRDDVEHVFATVRDPIGSSSSELKTLASSLTKIHIIKLELTEASAASAVEEVSKVLGAKGLDMLVNNIGIGQPFMNPDEASLSLFREQFEVNVLGPQIVTVAFLPLLRKGQKKTIMNISSFAGSIAYNDGRFPIKTPAYGASKAALNFLTAEYAKYLAPEGFTVVPLSPGYIKTRLSPEATITPEESATGIVKILFGLTPKDNAIFYSYDGTTHPY